MSGGRSNEGYNDGGFRAGPLGAGAYGGNGTSGGMEQPSYGGATAKGGSNAGMGSGQSNTGIQEQSLSSHVPQGAGVAPAVEQGFGLVSGGGQGAGFPGGASTHTQSPYTGSSGGGMSQGMSQGQSQGMSQGSSQGMSQGMSQGTSQGMSQGMSPTSGSTRRDRAHPEDEQRYNTAHALADSRIAEEAAAAGRAVTGHISVPHYKSEEPHIAEDRNAQSGAGRDGGRGMQSGAGQGGMGAQQAPSGANLASSGVASRAADVGARTTGHHDIPEYESEKPVKPAAVGAMGYSGAGGAGQGDRSQAQAAPPSYTQKSTGGSDSPYAPALSSVTGGSTNSSTGPTIMQQGQQVLDVGMDKLGQAFDAAKGYMPGQGTGTGQASGGSTYSQNLGTGASNIQGTAGQYAAVAQERAQPAVDAVKDYAAQAAQMAQPHVDQARDYATNVAQQAQMKGQEVLGQVREADLEGLMASPTARIAAGVFLVWLVVPFSLPWKTMLSLMVVGGIVAGLAVYARNRSGRPLMPARKGNQMSGGAQNQMSGGAQNQMSVARRTR